MSALLSLISFFQDTGYLAHGASLMWEPWLIALFAGADFLIVSAFAIIPLALHRVLRARKDLANRRLAYLFVAFILLCGLTHLAGIVTLWAPAYAIEGAIKLVTGLVSMATAMVLFPLVPRIIALPSPAALHQANARLTEEIAAHERTLSELRKVRDRLEDTVAERTRALERSKEEMSAILRQSGNRGRNLKALVQALARQTANQTRGREDFLDRFQARISAIVEASDALTRPDNGLPATIRALAETQLSAYLAAYPGRITISGGDHPLTPLAARQVGLALNELATNAIKHGALRDDGGFVALFWSRYRSWPDGRERFQLNWAETLPPERVRMRDFAEAAGSGRLGYGTRVLNITVPQRLNGKAEADFTPQGMSYTLDVPVECLHCHVVEFCATRGPLPQGCPVSKADCEGWLALPPPEAPVDRARRSA
ncbi:MAG: hypothetical protein EP318_04215 [Rhodobacteraceae bacterium]|nr:MAG: hypothetical protein EP318_04215 [Paracoccaceae bacterium]